MQADVTAPTPAFHEKRSRVPPRVSGETPLDPPARAGLREGGLQPQDGDLGSTALAAHPGRKERGKRRRQVPAREPTPPSPSGSCQTPP